MRSATPLQPLECHPIDLTERARRDHDRDSIRSQPQHRLGGSGDTADDAAIVRSLDTSYIRR